MPFVADHRTNALQAPGGVGVTQQHAQRLGCDHERGGVALALLGLDGLGGVAGALLDGPRQAEIADGLLEGVARVVGQRAQRLTQIGGNLFVESAASGEPFVGEPGQDQFGRIESGYLEGSNVDPTRELIELIRTQRAFEMISQVVRAADESLLAIGQLRRCSNELN